MAKPVANLRLFAAIYPPSHLVEAWHGVLASFDLPEHRLVRPEQVHLTLQFIGDTPAAQLERVIESVERSAAGLEPFRLTPIGLIRLPERGRARLIAVETDRQPTLLELQSRLAQRLARNVRAKPGQKYLPHITLCRFRSPTRVQEPSIEIGREPFEVSEIMLMRSTLKASGAEHVEVARVRLG